MSPADFGGRRLHFIAIGGAGMSALALAAHQLGARVTGSDRAESTYLSRLRGLGLDPRIGHDAAQVPDEVEVVVSTAIGEDNPELVRARERGQRVLHRSELMAELCATGRVIAVAGAHGKTTTSGMLTHALLSAGAEVSFLLGGELPGAGVDGAPSNAGWQPGAPIVVEADESDGSFLRLSPEVGLVTNIELDHHSHWSGEAELREAFTQFAAASEHVVSGAGSGLADGGEARSGVEYAVEGFNSDVELRAAAVRARGLESIERGTRFEVDGLTASPLTVELGVPGAHNVANATGALAALAAAGAGSQLPELSELAAGLAHFPGMGRRLERKGTSSGALIFDDYAHHPTEVEAALRALRELPHRRLIAVFQPHLYSRTRALAGRFGAALALADRAVVVDVYAAREEPVGELAGIDGRLVAEAAADSRPGMPVLWWPDLETVAEQLAGDLSEGDILATIGAGDIFRVAEQLVSGSS